MLNVIYLELVLYFSVCDCLLLIGTNVSDLNLYFVDWLASPHLGPFCQNTL